jgi:hypothetical protein
VNAEFNWWLLIVGLVIGAGLTWLVLADSRRREVDIVERERAAEALWIAEAMAEAGHDVDDGDVLEILRLHADYLAAGPPDEAVDDEGEGGVDGGVDGEDEGEGDGERALMAHPIAETGDRPGGAA